MDISDTANISILVSTDNQGAKPDNVEGFKIFTLSEYASRNEFIDAAKQYFLDTFSDNSGLVFSDAPAMETDAQNQTPLNNVVIKNFPQLITSSDVDEVLWDIIGMGHYYANMLSAYMDAYSLGGWVSPELTLSDAKQAFVVDADNSAQLGKHIIESSGWFINSDIPDYLQEFILDSGAALVGDAESDSGCYVNSLNYWFTA